MKKCLGSLLLLSMVIWFASCGSDDANDSDDTTNAELAAAPSSVGESSTSGNIGGLSRLLALVPTRGDCSAISYSACSNGTETRDFSPSAGDSTPCTRGSSHGRRAFGAALLSFSQTGCTFSTSGDSITHAFQNHYVQRGNNGNKVLVYTGLGTVAEQSLGAADLEDYTGTSHSGGSQLDWVSSSTATLTVNGIHRRMLHPNGKYGFWHTLYTDAGAPLNVTFSSSSLTINSGTLNLMHNRARKKITIAFNNVLFNQGCEHPQGGSAVITIPDDSGSGTSTVNVTYSGTGCGVASIDGVSSQLDGVE